MKIFIVTHGQLAFGLENALSMMLENYENIYFAALADDGVEVLMNNLKSQLNEDETVLFLCDLPGGSPANTCYLLSLQLNLNSRIITGVNFGMLLAVALTSKTKTLDQLAEYALENGASSIQEIKFDLNLNEEDE